MLVKYKRFSRLFDIIGIAHTKEGFSMLNYQQKMVFSKYMELYDILIPKGHFLRKFKELVDFSFVERELREHYCLTNGRNAIDPVRLFKYLLLKTIHRLSDVDLVERSRYDLSFKYFLDMAPEDDVIHPSTLTKFRKLRIKDESFLDILIGKSVEIALSHGVLKSELSVMDATHILSRHRFHTKRETLLEAAKELRHSVYKIQESMKEHFCQKPTGRTTEEAEHYCQNLIQQIREREELCEIPSIKERLAYLEELLSDIAEIKTSVDPDARNGHKSEANSFFGYKAHLSMTDERIITALVVTPGSEVDGSQLQKLVEKSRDNGVTIKSVIGDAAYGIEKNLLYASQNGVEGKENPEKIDLIAPLMVSETHESSSKEGFEYNKDAGMYQCPAGHLSITKEHRKEHINKKGNTAAAIDIYRFDVENCKYCSQRENCYQEGAKTKSYCVSRRLPIYKDHKEYQESNEFKEKYKERYKIEAKNSELKHRYGCARAIGTGLFALQLQMANAIFAANMKRIIRLMDNNNRSHKK